MYIFSRFSGTFFWCSVFDNYGSKTLILKNLRKFIQKTLSKTCWYGFKKSLALISIRDSFYVLAGKLILSPVKGSKPGYFCTSLQTSFIDSADISLISLYSNVTNHAFYKKVNVAGFNLIHRYTEQVDLGASNYIWYVKHPQVVACLVYINVLLVEVIWASYMIQVFDWICWSFSDSLSFFLLFDLILFYAIVPFFCIFNWLWFCCFVLSSCYLVW